MDPLTPLRPGLAAALQAEAGWAWVPEQSGTEPRSLLQLARAHPRIFDPETFAQMRQLRDREESAVTRAVLQQLTAYLAHLNEALATWPHRVEAWAKRNQRADVETSDGRFTLPDALARLAALDQRPEREALQRALGDFLRDASEPELRALEAAEQSAHALGYPSYLACREDVGGLTGKPLVAAAQSFLSETDDAYQDLVLFLLRRSGALSRTARLGDARWHDWRHLVRARGPSGAPDAAGLLARVEGWLEGWGLAGPKSPRVDLRLRRPGSDTANLVSRLDGRVGLQLSMEPSPEAAFRLLESVADLQRVFGELDHEDDPIEARSLVSASVAAAHRTLYRQLLTDVSWLRRCAEVQRDQARELALAYGVLELGNLRSAAAQVLYRQAFAVGGSPAQLQERFRDLTSRALGVQVPSGFWLWSLAPELSEAHQLEGAWLAAHLRRHLTETFDVDYFRNPAAARWLRARIARGARETPESLARAVDVKPELELKTVAKELIAVVA